MPIPSAGVGTFFSYAIMKTLRNRFKTWFEEGNLTEDYEISMKIARLGGKQRFLLITDENNDVVSTREYFPDAFGRSVRQKARWTTGIGLQTMNKWGLYSKKLSFKNILAWYGLWRDRKAIWLNPFTFIGWGASAVIVAIGIQNPEWWQELRHPELIRNLMFANLLLMGWRLVQKVRFTSILFGPAHGLYAIPRTFLAAVINGLSAIRAVKLYNEASKKGKNPEREIKWDKTAHVFPSAEAIRRSLERTQ
jgi:adsorption protein B